MSVSASATCVAIPLVQGQCEQARARFHILLGDSSQTINEELRLGHTGPYDGQLKSLTHRQSFRFAFENHSDLGDDGVRLGLLALADGNSVTMGSVVPEPASYALLVLGLCAMWHLARRLKSRTDRSRLGGADAPIGASDGNRTHI